jgi:hypothetical protein
MKWGTRTVETWSSRWISCCHAYRTSSWIPPSLAPQQPGARILAVFRIRDPSSFRTLDPGSRINISDHILVTIYWVKKCLNSCINSVFRIQFRDPGRKIEIQDPGYGMEKSRFGFRDKHPGSAALFTFSRSLFDALISMSRTLGGGGLARTNNCRSPYNMFVSPDLSPVSRR